MSLVRYADIHIMVRFKIMDVISRHRKTEMLRENIPNNICILYCMFY